MSHELMRAALVSGGINGAAVLLPTLAVALLYQHGRYVPVWLPDLGLVGAYLTHATLKAGLQPVPAVVLACATAAFLSWAIHRALIADFLKAGDPLSPLLIGLGLSQVLQASAALYGDGMSQHYPANPFERAIFVKSLGISVSVLDLGFVVASLIALIALDVFLRTTHKGLVVRAVMANPDLARTRNLPVARVDAVVLASASLLVCLGAIMRGLRFDLQPSMMFYPGLAAIAACVTAGPGHRNTALLVAILVEIAGALLGASPGLSPLQRAVPFLLLVGAVTLRGVLPRGRRSVAAGTRR